jgi:hypothetical protein
MGDADFGDVRDSEPASSAVLRHPVGLALTSGHDLLVADADANKVYRLEIASGTVATAAGSGDVGYGMDPWSVSYQRLSAPISLVALGDGSFLIGERGTFRVRRASPEVADLQLGTSPAPALFPGSTAVWELTLTNTGPSVANGAYVTVESDDDTVTSISDAVSSAGSCFAMSPTVCSLGDIPASGMVTVSLTLSAGGEGTTTLRIRSRSLRTDMPIGNSSDQVAVHVFSPQALFADGFESGGTTNWATTQP